MDHYCVSPLDGRYRDKVNDVNELFSDYMFTRFKVTIECEYLYFMLNTLQVTTQQDYGSIISNFISNFSYEDDVQIKKLEKQTNHDIQAIVLYLKTKFPDVAEYIHFGLTSQDINSPAMVYTYKVFNDSIFLPDIKKLRMRLSYMAETECNQTMLTFTHGQPATPSTMSRQFNVFINKLSNTTKDLTNGYCYTAKMGGSNGSLSALRVVYPQYNWDHLLASFLGDAFGIYRTTNTTQIDDYINYYKLFQIYERFCLIIIDLCSDIWMYCGKGYFKQNNVDGEVGSSAMPHKINPIYFENAEGNAKIACDLYTSIGKHISVNRLQRDLTDSTILRNVGVANGHMILAIRNVITGLERITINSQQIKKDLDNNNIVLMEFIQLKMRSIGITNSYDLCKEFSRGKTSFTHRDFIHFLQVNNVTITDELMSILRMNIHELI